MFRKGRTWILLFLILAVLVSGSYLLGNYCLEQKAEELFLELSEQEHTGDVLAESLIKRNTNCIGWISIPGTSFSYPVMGSSSENPEYYLHRDFDKKYSFYGTPFLDYRCRLQSDNLIIYGHNINGLVLCKSTGKNFMERNTTRLNLRRKQEKKHIIWYPF